MFWRKSKLGFPSVPKCKDCCCCNQIEMLTSLTAVKKNKP